MSKKSTAVDAKSAILQRISSALAKANSATQEAEHINLERFFFQAKKEDTLVQFAETFASLQGQFSYCLNTTELQEQLHQLMEQRQWTKVYCAEPLLRGQLTALGFSKPFHTDIATCDVAITSVEALVARTGSMVLSSALTNGRTGSAYAPVHIAIAYSRQVVADIADAISMLQDRYQGNIPSFFSFASGPSRTADIEKTLVTGVHGPGEVFCFVVESTDSGM